VASTWLGDHHRSLFIVQRHVSTIKASCAKNSWSITRTTRQTSFFELKHDLWTLSNSLLEQLSYGAYQILLTVTLLCVQCVCVRTALPGISHLGSRVSIFYCLGHYKSQ